MVGLICKNKKAGGNNHCPQKETTIVSNNVLLHKKESWATTSNIPRALNKENFMF